MKNFSVSFVFLFVIMAFSAKAQFSIGVKGGYTRAWEDYGENRVLLPEDAKIHVHRFNLSLSVYRQLGKHWQIGLEPGYAGRGAACVPGWEFYQPVPVFRGDTRFRLNYLEMPLMFRFEQSFGGGKVYAFASAGYGFSYLISGFREVVDLDTGAKVSTVDIAEELTRWEHGPYGSLGFGFPVKEHIRCFLAATYYRGLVNVDPFNPSQARALNVDLGFAFSL